MGKKQHSKDQLYITTTEWGRDWGGKKRCAAAVAMPPPPPPPPPLPPDLLLPC